MSPEAVEFLGTLFIVWGAGWAVGMIVLTIRRLAEQI